MNDYRFKIPYSVRIADINYGGHVANSSVLNFFQDARIAYLSYLGGYSELDVGNGCGLLLPEAHVRYRSQMYLHDQLEIGVRISQLKRSSFTMEYCIERDFKTAVEGTTIMVCFDYTVGKIKSFDKAFLAKVNEFEKLSP
ncbi:MAG: acyl-CoA thioesterase [Deltaproteobacteria bacterium]|nr:acyl-CoA thioesterase [Deltaproteobacteria bacterium]